MSKAWPASGVITLTTDFGLQDPFVGVMKGAILTRYPAANIVDLTHAIQAYRPAEAGFWLSRSFRYFPTGTIHAAVVDPGVGTNRNILILEVEGHCFLAPDNGLLTPLLQRHPKAQVYALQPNFLQDRELPPASATFHGRDVFAPLAAELAQGRCRPADLGSIASEIVLDLQWEPVALPDAINGTVVTIDRFGNLITNIESQYLDRFSTPVLRMGEFKCKFARTYGDAAAGEYLALINAFGVIEIARVQGDASAGLNVRPGASVTLCDAH